MAVYRSGWRNKQLRVARQFWITANGNALDIAVLEWCKLFAESNGKHHWRTVIADPDAFLAGLYATLRMSPKQYSDFVALVVRYRNKFVAHLDEDREMHLPRTRVLRKSTAYLFNQLRTDAVDKQYIPDAPPSALAHYSLMYRHALSEHLRNAA